MVLVKVDSTNGISKGRCPYAKEWNRTHDPWTFTNTNFKWIKTKMWYLNTEIARKKAYRWFPTQYSCKNEFLKWTAAV